MSIGGGQPFRNFRSRHNDISRRFVRDILCELAQHTNSVKLNPRHDQHEEYRHRQRKLDDMGTLSR